MNKRIMIKSLVALFMVIGYSTTFSAGDATGGPLVSSALKRLRDAVSSRVTGMRTRLTTAQDWLKKKVNGATVTTGHGVTKVHGFMQEAGNLVKNNGVKTGALVYGTMCVAAPILNPEEHIRWYSYPAKLQKARAHFSGPYFDAHPWLKSSLVHGSSMLSFIFRDFLLGGTRLAVHYCMPDFVKYHVIGIPRTPKEEERRGIERKRAGAKAENDEASVRERDGSTGGGSSTPRGSRALIGHVEEGQVEGGSCEREHKERAASSSSISTSSSRSHYDVPYNPQFPIVRSGGHPKRSSSSSEAYPLFTQAS